MTTNLLEGLHKKAESLQTYTWQDLQEHKGKQDAWIVVENLVFNVSTWMKKHPGGARIIAQYAGQDATDAWTAMHIDRSKVVKYMGPLLIGTVKSCHSDETSDQHQKISEEFRALRRQVEEAGLFAPQPLFYLLQISHIILLEIIAYWLLSTWGVGWATYLLAALLLTTAQAQSGWSQHDYGHLSVMSNSRLNHIMHYFVIGHLKGASAHWWNFRHYLHHTKPNIVGKDPDIAVPYLFLLGTKMPVVWGQRKQGHAPYNLQQLYFWLIGPPLLLPLYFHYENVLFMFKRKDWIDMLTTLSFFVRFFYCYGPLLGGWGAFCLYMFVRFLESHWFTLITQMNHIPMEVDRDNPVNDWVTMQTSATCNVTPSLFNNWFTGHLNFQIEHHMFPTMPRHNYSKVAPLVRSLCKKHDVPYIEKELSTAITDIYRSLRKSGLLWYEAYYN